MEENKGKKNGCLSQNRPVASKKVSLTIEEPLKDFLYIDSKRMRESKDFCPAPFESTGRFSVLPSHGPGPLAV